MATGRASALPPATLAPAQITAPAAEQQTPELPEAVVASILQHVPVKERLTRCAMVCCSWAAAAVAVPGHVVLYGMKSERCTQLQDWLRKLGGAAGQVTASGSALLSTRPVLQLPILTLTQLRRLQLTYLNIQLLQGVTTCSGTSGPRCSALSGASSIAASRCGDAAAAAAVLPQLQELRLSYCRLTMPLLCQLLSATALTKLQWQWVTICTDSQPDRLPLQQVLAVVWQRLQLLPNISVLQLKQLQHLTSADIIPGSNLQHLQSLSVEVRSHNDATRIAAVVSTGLTALDLEASAGWEPEEPGIQSALCLARLPHLQTFRGKYVCTAFSTLASRTGLRRLCLSNPIDAHREELSASGTRELLSALQHLTQLQHLELNDWCEPPEDEEPPQQQWDSYQCFSALTASPQLTALVLKGYVQPLAQEAIEHVFPAGRTLPNLRVLQLSRAMLYDGIPPCVEAAQIGMIAASCPALQELKLSGVTRKGFDTSCLAQLPPGITQVEGLDWSRPAP